MSENGSQSLGSKLEQNFRTTTQNNVAEEVASLKPLAAQGTKELKFSLVTVKVLLFLAVFSLGMLAVGIVSYARGETTYAVAGIFAGIACAVCTAVLYPKTKEYFLQMDASGMRLAYLDRAIPWQDILEVEEHMILDSDATMVHLPAGYPLTLLKSNKRVMYDAAKGELEFMNPAGHHKDEENGFRDEFFAYYQGGKARARLKELGAE